MTIRARAARTGDLPAMKELLADLFAIEKDFSPDGEKQETGLLMLLSDRRARVVVAVEKGVVFGMVTGQLLTSTAEGAPSVLVEDLVVAKEARGRGVGSLLLGEIEKWGRKKGAARLQLVADRDNGPARDFYEKAGWKVTNLLVLRKTEAEITLCPGKPGFDRRQK